MVNSRQKLEISPEKWNHRVRVNGVRPNRRLQLTAFGARDRAFFDVVLCRAPRRQLKRNTLDGALSHLIHTLSKLSLCRIHCGGCQATRTRSHLCQYILVHPTASTTFASVRPTLHRSPLCQLPQTFAIRSPSTWMLRRSARISTTFAFITTRRRSAKSFCTILTGKLAKA